MPPVLNVWATFVSTRKFGETNPDQTMIVSIATPERVSMGGVTEPELGAAEISKETTELKKIATTSAAYTRIIEYGVIMIIKNGFKKYCWIIRNENIFQVK